MTFLAEAQPLAAFRRQRWDGRLSREADRQETAPRSRRAGQHGLVPDSDEESIAASD
jgi:hypothetical protein